MALGVALGAALASAIGCGRSDQRQDEPRDVPAGGEATGGSYGGSGGAAQNGGAATAGTAFVTGGSAGTAEGGAAPDLTSYSCLTSSDCPLNGDCTGGFCECPEVTPTFCPLYSVDFQAPGCVSLLRNPGRCGDCNKACPAYTSCRDGECSESPTLLSDLGSCDRVQALAVAGSELYYWSSATDSVGSIAIDDAPVAPIPSLGSDLAIAVDESAIYWLTAGESTSIMRRPFALGEAPEVLASGAAGEPISDFTVHGGSVYYARGAEIHALSSGANGWEDSVIVSSPPGGLPHWLVAADDFVIWYDQTSLHQDDLVPGNDGYQLLLATFAHGLALDGEHVYWWRGELLDRLEVGTTESELVARVPGETVQHVAFGTEHLYMASGKTIYRQSREPSADGEPVPVETFALAETAVTAIVLSSEHLYWAAGCKLQRLTL